MSTAVILKQPIDLAAPLHPTRIIYIHALGGRTHSEIFDFTSQLQSSYHSDVDSQLLEAAQRIFNANTAIRPTWRLEKDKAYSSSRITVNSPAAAGGQRARWHSPILGYGNTKISFSRDSPHCSHGLEVKPLKIFDPGMTFIKDSVNYVWQAASPSSQGTKVKTKGLSLFKSVGIGRGGKKTEVARYRSLSGKFEVGGVLVVEAGEIDVLIALLTLCATLNQRDAFYCPGLGCLARSPSMADGLS